MKVKELIDKLKQYNQDLVVVTRDSEFHGFFEIKVCQPIKAYVVPEDYKEHNHFVADYDDAEYLFFCTSNNEVELILIDFEEYRKEDV